MAAAPAKRSTSLASKAASPKRRASVAGKRNAATASLAATPEKSPPGKVLKSVLKRPAAAA